jgi:hypothetical protein
MRSELAIGQSAVDLQAVGFEGHVIPTEGKQLAGTHSSMDGQSE